MKKAFIILAGIVGLLVVISVFKDFVVKVSVENGVRFVTGLKLGINSFNVGILRPVVSIGGLKLYNPPGFRDRVMLDMPRIYVNYDLAAILGGVIHLREVRLNMKELVVVKNENGDLNLNSLKIVKAEGRPGPAKAGEGRPPKIKIDRLGLKIGKAVYKDYSKGGEPSVREYNINIDETYSDIDDPNALAGLIIVRALANTSISSLANFDLNNLQSTVSDTISKARDIANQATGAADTTKQIVANTVDELQSILKNPFGGGK